ncbi:MAG: glycosyltransferase family 1 protein, partial [Cyanobacteria bacterium REEB65]|nr:glycosyltransferase family 1 protein [Cyanobacteria bacterium REEB65]
MPLEANELSKDAKGGTELMLQWLYESQNPALLERFQIIPSRVRQLAPDKIRVLWVHLAAHHPESQHLASGGWAMFDKIVFVSHTQQQSYIQRFGIPWSKCAVIPNAIVPIADHAKPAGTIRLIYTPMPDRGLVLLVPVFAALCEKFPDLELDVFSSYKLYGWPEADAPLQPLFDACRT